MKLSDHSSTVVDLEALGAFRLDLAAPEKIYVIVDGCSMTCSYDDENAARADYKRLLAEKFPEEAQDV